MLKEYRIRKLKQKRLGYLAKYTELVRIMATLKESPSYLIERLVEYQGNISEIDAILAYLEG